MMRLIAILLAFYVTLRIENDAGSLQIEVPVSQEFYEQAYVGQRVHYRQIKRVDGKRPVVKVVRKDER